MTLDDFKRWKIPELKQFLRCRGLSISGFKEELVALAYGAAQLRVPVKDTQQEVAAKKAQQYNALLLYRGKPLPDPVLELTDGWLNETLGMEKWPPIMQFDIAKFLLSAGDSGLEKRMIHDHKESKAFSYFNLNWLGGVFYQG